MVFGQGVVSEQITPFAFALLDILLCYCGEIVQIDVYLAVEPNQALMYHRNVNL